ncbi:UDP-glycosyltransferase 79B30-like [Senna tora]|uniref:Glycosyltransferase n=1 Tax=Senna tora TaxID=362788 RepID=A0A834TDI5_9FABA|nr:UDP-glycosyltransferase 79B30-like [Senna tora]
MDVPSMHIAMYPWFAIGHIAPYLQLSNKLAKRGHKISIFIPKTTQSKLQHLNLFPHLITIFPINIPHVQGLPDAAETTKDLDPSLFPLLMTAMDRTEKEMETLLLQLKPNFVFFDFTYWIPNLARKLGIKSVQYWVVSLVTGAYAQSRRSQTHGEEGSNIGLRFPDKCIKLQPHEEKMFAKLKEMEFGSGIRFYDRTSFGLRSSDAVGFMSCREIEGPFADYYESLVGKPVLLSGPIMAEPSESVLEEKWADWLARFKAGSVIYCAFGSECILSHHQFQELLLGMPFLTALKPPHGFESVEAAMPEGFAERVKERGIVYGGWVQQQLILKHPSLGCFITHCGSSSLLEALLSQCQLVLLPNMLDHIITTRMVSKSLKAGVEVQRGEEDGLFTKDSVCEALRIVMDDESEVAKEIRENHTKLRSLLLSNNFENGYIDSFCQSLHKLL